MMIYFIVIGDILASYGSKMANVPEWEVFYSHRGFYVFLVALVLSPFIFKREIHELKIASYFLLFSIILFIVVFSIELGTRGTHANKDTDYSQYYKFSFNRQFFTAISVFVTAYGFQ